MSIRAIHRAGSQDLLIDLDSLDAVLALNAALEASPLPGQRDLLAAAQTVLLKFDSGHSAERAMQALPGLAVACAVRTAGKLVEVPVHYDGEDLAVVAELTGLSVEAVVNAHTSQTWRAVFGGFAPGFAYLLGENQELNVPRRDTPRTKVPAGAVALAGEYSAVYPRQSPGGWQLIGHTDLHMWDLQRENPALIRPQDTVQFVPATEKLSVSQAPAARVEEPEQTSGGGLKIIDAGLQSLLQDAGRIGYGNLGVGVAGAADPTAFRQANRLVGNRMDQAAIENLGSRITVEACGDQVLAHAGAQAQLWITPAEDDQVRTTRQVASNAPFALLHGERLSVEPGGQGLRSYLAVRGEITLNPVLGSLSTDTLSGVGPDPLVSGSVIPVQQPSVGHIVGNPQPSTLPVPDDRGVYQLRVLPGPRTEWFGPAGLKQLAEQLWDVTSESNRVGIRLSTGDQPLQRVLAGELASEGVARGSLQVPPSGLPVLFLADHPVTGGYPVIATVISEDLSAAAQLPPGSKIQFVLQPPAALTAK
ncbi:carboxyltransferase domain-containing protein [Glutamicibacter halophytocola]|uniref:Carboxyltransferase domain-containing protein n=1 Tax=Glutamicibacter halophytocola TaxID=1933880 RepID=A0ABX5YCS5_9MICC|nr:carboxyltransferase domain-containing protein [Glutamicibacter halophytocola]MBF6672600.1 carboxyltransferase domain-containing protein [Glutamicibacter sp. FBE19]QDY67467.1 carboxyltransferase domain-containing protein [Glutamicibacter halophytocola]